MIQGETVARGRWGIAARIGRGIVVGYFHRVCLSVYKEARHDAFGMSAVMLGFLPGAHNWPYASPPSPPPPCFCKC